MATVSSELDVWGDIPPASNFPTKDVSSGTNYPVRCLDFDPATNETTFFVFQAVEYGSGNITCRLRWYADTASSGSVVWVVSLATITPNTSTQDIETKAFATSQSATTAHLGTTGQRLHETSVAISNLDSIVAGDWCVLRVVRDAANGSDDMAGDASLVAVLLEWSDT
jgi:hypothetical protein